MRNDATKPRRISSSCEGRYHEKDVPASGFYNVASRTKGPSLVVSKTSVQGFSSRSFEPMASWLRIDYDYDYE